MMTSSSIQGEPYLTSNVTTTVMHGLTDSSGNHVVVRVMNDGISVCCGDAEWRGRVVDLLPEVNKNVHETTDETLFSQHSGSGSGRVPRG